MDEFYDSERQGYGHLCLFRVKWNEWNQLDLNVILIWFYFVDSKSMKGRSIMFYCQGQTWRATWESYYHPLWKLWLIWHPSIQSTRDLECSPILIQYCVDRTRIFAKFHWTFFVRIFEEIILDTSSPKKDFYVKAISYNLKLLHSDFSGQKVLKLRKLCLALS